MWNGYYYKLLGSWTLPLYNLPRWFEVNSNHPTLSDPIEIPALTSAPTGTTLAASVSGYALPLDWQLTDVSPTKRDSLDRILEVFVNENEYLNLVLTHLHLNRSLFYDLAEPEYVWISESQDKVEKIEVQLSDGSWETITEADSALDLFYSSNWRWKQENNVVFLYGFGIQAQTATTKSSGWQFLDNLYLWTDYSILYIEHPETKNWFPVHPSKIRSDGFLGFHYDGNLRLRGNLTSASSGLEIVQLRINGVEQLAQKLNIYNSVDEKANWFGLTRRHAETNQSLGDSTLLVAWFGDYTKNGVRNALAATLRTGTTQSVPASSVGFTLPADATGYSVKNVNRFNYVLENRLEWNTSPGKFRTRIADSDLSAGFLQNRKASYTVDASGYLNFTHVVNRNDLVSIMWKVEYWTESGSSILFTDNMPDEVPHLLVYFPKKVEVNNPSLATKKLSFERTSPTKKWSSVAVEEPNIKGISVFDFS